MHAVSIWCGILELSDLYDAMTLLHQCSCASPHDTPSDWKVEEGAATLSRGTLLGAYC